jgi:hypothetical protein
MKIRMKHHQHLESRLKKFTDKHDVSKAMLEDIQAIIVSYAQAALKDPDVAEEAQQLWKAHVKKVINRISPSLTLE